MSESNLKKIDVLGVKVDDVSMEQAVSLVGKWIDEKDSKKRYIVTPNPEFIMLAQKDQRFRKILNQADLAIPDGKALQIFGGVKNLVGGVYLMEKICSLSEEKSFTVGFLGGRNGVAKQAAECLVKKYPGLKVVFTEDGPKVNSMGYEVYGIKGKKIEEILPHTKYKIPNTDILFVGFGQVKQEKWIADNLQNLPVKVAMGVGGSFDEIAGKVPMVPNWVHRLGIKWLIRLVFQPWRIRRQVSLVGFVWKIISG